MTRKPKTWTIWDFPDKLYILFNKKAHKEFFNYMFNKFGGKRPYARFLGISQMHLKQYWSSYSKKGGKKYIQYIQLKILKKSCTSRKLEKVIEQGIVKIRVRAGKPITNPKLRIKESPELYRIVAHLIGDGFAGDIKVPYYSNTYKELRYQFKKDLQIFGKIKTYERTPNTVTCLMFPKPISDILRHIFKIEFIRPTKLPKEIFSASDKCKGAFLQALFDDEGCISTSLALAMSNQNLVNEIKYLIESLGIKTNGVYKSRTQNMFTLQIKRPYYHIFMSRIGFLHPSKSKNLGLALKTNERYFTKRARPLEESRSDIIKILRTKPSSTLDLANKLLFTMPGLYPHLRYLERKGKIIRTRDQNRITWGINHGRIQEQI